jgi:hypothetical protein
MAAVRMPITPILHRISSENDGVELSADRSRPIDIIDTRIARFVIIRLSH